MTRSARRAVVTILMQEHALPVQRAWVIARCSRTAGYRAPATTAALPQADHSACKRDVVPLAAPARLHDTWAMDFMGDSLYSGRAYRRFNVLDEGNREALAIEVDVSLPSARAV